MIRLEFAISAPPRKLSEVTAILIRRTFLRVMLLLSVGAGVAKADDASYPERPAPARLEKSGFLIAPAEPGISAEFKEEHAGEHLSGDYRLYIDADGRVRRAEVVRSIPGCDQWVIKQLTNVHHMGAVHEAMRFVHHVELTFSVPLTAAPAGQPPKYRAVPPLLLTTSLINYEEPKMPPAVAANAPQHGRYMLYVEFDGHVSRVDVVESIPGGDPAVIEAIKKWKYKPQPELVRFIIDYATSKSPSRR
jgi:hypothetical protein